MPKINIKSDDQDATSTSPPPGESNDEKFPWLTENQLRYLWTTAANNPQQKIFHKNSSLPYTVIRFNQNCFVACGKYLGSGFFGNVHVGVRYERGQTHSRGIKCIFKTEKITNIFGKVINDIIDVNKKMTLESTLSRKIYGMGDTVNTIEDDVNKTSIVMPYLGDYSLEELLERTDIIRKIPMREWLNFFAVLLVKLEKMHVTTHYLHNDIKPKNIGVSIREVNNVVTFTAVNYFDLGNAQKINDNGLFGDPKYQPVESLTIGLLIPQVKDERVDIYALGKSFLKIMRVLKRHHLHESEYELYRRCKKIFYSMSSFDICSRPAVQECINMLRQICVMRHLDMADLDNFIVSVVKTPGNEI